MPTVENTIIDPVAGPIDGAEVEIRLVGSTSDSSVGGFDTADDKEILGVKIVRTNADGKWTASLEPNVNIQPTGTYYEVREWFRRRKNPRVLTFEVPVAAGPHWVYDILVTPPASIATAHESDPTGAHAASAISFSPVGTLASTNAQDAIAEAASEAAAGTHNHDATYVNEVDHTLSAHDILGLATQAELDAHAVDATAVHGITDSAQLATLDTAQTLTAKKILQGAISAAEVLGVRVAADGFDRIQLRPDGIRFGDGAAAPTMTFGRQSAGVFRMAPGAQAVEFLDSPIAGAGGPMIQGVSAIAPVFRGATGAGSISARFVNSDVNNGAIQVGSLSLDARSTSASIAQSWAPLIWTFSNANPGNEQAQFVFANQTGVGMKLTASNAGLIPLLQQLAAAQTAAARQVKNFALQVLIEETAGGQVQLPVQGSAGGLRIGTDVDLYRSAANVLRTDDDFHVRNASGTSILRMIPSGVAGVVTAFEFFLTDFQTDSTNWERFNIRANRTSNEFHLFADAAGTGQIRGIQIGTAPTQKFGFYGATPITQPTGIADADGTLTDITTKFNSLLSKLESVGLLAVA